MHADSIAINDVSYKKGTFYAVDSDVLKYSNVALQSIRVYVDDRNGANDIQTGASPGRAYLEAPDGPVPPSQGPSQRGMFDQLVELGYIGRINGRQGSTFRYLLLDDGSADPEFRFGGEGEPEKAGTINQRVNGKSSPLRPNFVTTSPMV